MAKERKGNRLREVLVQIERMRTALKKAQRELDLADQAAKQLKKLLGKADRKPAADKKKNSNKAAKGSKKARKEKKAQMQMPASSGAGVAPTA